MIAKAIVKDGGLFIPDIKVDNLSSTIVINVELLEENKKVNKFSKYFNSWSSHDNTDIDIFLQDQRRIDKDMWDD